MKTLQEQLTQLNKDIKEIGKKARKNKGIMYCTKDENYITKVTKIRIENLQMSTENLYITGKTLRTNKRIFGTLNETMFQTKKEAEEHNRKERIIRLKEDIKWRKSQLKKIPKRIKRVKQELEKDEKELNKLTK